MFPISLEDSIEGREYLRGVLFSDKDYRLDTAFNVDLIDPYGTGNKAFWRGVLESSGSITMPMARGERSNPRLAMTATPPVLHKFIEFVQEETNIRSGMEWAWDADGKLAWQANGGFLRLAGPKAQEAVLALYLGQHVGRASCRKIADDIADWISR